MTGALTGINAVISPRQLMTDEMTGLKCQRCLRDTKAGAREELLTCAHQNVGHDSTAWAGACQRSTTP